MHKQTNRLGGLCSSALVEPQTRRGGNANQLIWHSYARGIGAYAILAGQGRAGIFLAYEVSLEWRIATLHLVLTLGP